ncbi:MAG: flagellar hook-associated protein FlgL [bacterium]|nr:flagellar hook-associated protein FlgL [bacterium]
MTERISTAYKYAQLIADMRMNQFNYDRLTAQLASGKKLTSIIDDPIIAVNSINTGRQLGQIETFQQNVDMATTELDALDDLMALASSYLSNAWGKAVQANNQTYGDGSLQALKVEIDETIKTMVDLANTEYDNNYIFAGANTKTVPYEIDDDGNIIYNGTEYTNADYIRQTEVADGVFETINVPGDKIFGTYVKKDITRDSNGYEVEQADDGKYYYTTKVPYTGSESDLEVTLTDNNSRVVIQKDDGNYYYEDDTLYQGNTEDLHKTIKDADGNLVTQDKDGNYFWVKGKEYTGDEGDLTTSEEEVATGVMGALKKLSNSIQKVLDGHSAEDDDLARAGYEEMNATLDMFADSHQNILNEQTRFGGIYNRMEMSASTLETNSENLTTYLSNMTSVDYAEAITQWMNAQYAYQASMQVAASTMGMSLLNYL